MSRHNSSAEGTSIQFAGGGEMCERIRRFDWSKTPLGPMESWSPALRMMTNFLLANRFPMLLWWGPEFVQIYNDPYIPVLGTKHPSPGLGRPVSECWSEIWDVLRPLIETPYHGGPSTWMEDIFLEINRHGFKEETHFTIAYSPVPDETTHSGIGGVLATVHEITEKVVGERRIALLRELGAHSAEAKTAEDACISAAKTLRNAKDIPFALFYLFDPEGKNARLAAVSGMPIGTLASPITIQLQPENQSDGWAVAQALKSGHVQAIEGIGKMFADIPCGPWSEPPHSAAVVPIRSNIPHQLAGFIIAGVSPRRRFDEGYRSFFELLSTQVATAVANARAYEDERKRAQSLAELDRAKTTFFSNVSHELRTPLTLMLGPIEESLALKNETLPEQVTANLTIAHRNSLRLLKLVNTLLDFSRIEAGRVEANYEPTNLPAFTAELASLFRSAIEKAGLRFVIDCPPLPEPVFIDHAMWEKIVLNLIGNAFKFTFEGEIKVSLRQLDNIVELAVSDTGVGIPGADLPKVFERFHRVRDSKGRTHEGTGIGLALVQELTRFHGGDVTVKSKPGEGSTFCVTIKPGRAHLPSDRVRETGQSSAAKPAFSSQTVHWLPNETSQNANPQVSSNAAVGGRRARVLLADDNADMREYVSRLLSADYDVEAVADGAQALQSVRTSAPDLVLTDVMMPNLDGVELLRALRADMKTHAIPVIMLSARAGDEARLDGLGAGANDYLSKPFTARELLARVHAQLEMARMRSESEKAVRASEERFRAFVTASSDVVYWMNADWTEMRYLQGRDFIESTTDTNRSWLQKYIHPDDQAAVLAAVNKAIGAKSLFQLEHRVLRVDGTPGWTFSRAVPLFDSKGEIKEWFGAASDITERKVVEETLRKNRERFELMREGALVGFWFCDLPFDELVWDDRVKEHFWLQPHERVTIKTFYDRLHPDDRERTRQAIESSIANKSCYEIEYRTLNADGHEKWIRAIGRAFYDEKGNPLRFDGVTLDVTQRRSDEKALQEAQEKLRLHAHDLERTVAERTAKLQETVHELEAFSYTIAHDLRAPLRSLNGLSHFLRDEYQDKIDEKGRDYLQRLMRASSKMDQLITDVLNYSQIVRSVQPLVPVDSKKLLDDIIQFYPAIHNKSAQIAIEGGFPPVLANEARLTQCFSNLLGNAIKFTAPNVAPRVKVWAEVKSDRVRIFFQDNGIGIAPDQHEKIFAIFQRVSKDYEGTGIGLAIVKKSAERMGGNVGLESGLGKGSTFWIELDAVLGSGK